MSKRVSNQKGKQRRKARLSKDPSSTADMKAKRLKLRRFRDQRRRDKMAKGKILGRKTNKERI